MTKMQLKIWSESSTGYDELLCICERVSGWGLLHRTGRYDGSIGFLLLLVLLLHMVPMFLLYVLFVRKIEL